VLPRRRDKIIARDRAGSAPGGDYLPEMQIRSQIDDATAEALFAGQPVPPALEPLIAALAAYRRAADRPVRPSRELAAALATGEFAATAVPCRPVVWDRDGRGRRPAAGRRRRPSRMPAVEVVAVAAAKLAGLSLAAKALAGVAIATVGVGTAGFAGALPGPAQERFDTVVESVTPISFPDRASENAEFGEEVSEDARDGGVDGTEISEKARQLGDQHAPVELPAVVPGTAGQPAQPGPPSDLPTPGLPGPPDPPPGEDHRPTAPPGR
jgi:hypothetical protein